MTQFEALRRHPGASHFRSTRDLFTFIFCGAKALSLPPFVPGLLWFSLSELWASYCASVLFCKAPGPLIPQKMGLEVGAGSLASEMQLAVPHARKSSVS